MEHDDAADRIETMAKATFEGVRHWLARRSGAQLASWDAEDEWLKDVFRQAHREAVRRDDPSHRPADLAAGNGHQRVNGHRRVNGNGNVRATDAAAAIARYY
jgi:hypothetical protein